MKEKRRTRNYFGALVVTIVGIVGFSAFAFYVLSLAGIVDSIDSIIPNFNPGEFATEAILVVGLYFLGLAAPLASSNFLSLIIALVLSGFAIRLLDKRLLPGIEEEGEPTELGGKEIYTTKPGEQFETLAKPEWTITHAENTLPTALKATGRGAALSTLSALVSLLVVGVLNVFGTRIALVWAILPTYLVTFPLILLRMVPRYWRVEWLRDNTLYILFTHTLIKLLAGESLPGIFTGNVADPTRQDTPLTEVVEIDSAANPSKVDRSLPNYRLLGLPVWDWFLDIMGGVKGVRTHFIRSQRASAQDILLHVPDANGFREVMKHLIARSLELSEDQKAIERKARDLRLGDPNDPAWSEKVGESLAAEYVRTRTQHLGQQKMVNLFRLKFAKPRWDKNGKPIIMEGPEGEAGLVSLASRMEKSSPETPPTANGAGQTPRNVSLPKLPRR